MLHRSDSSQYISLNHLLVSFCSVVVDYEGIIQCARFPRSTAATQATSFCSLRQSELTIGLRAPPGSTDNPVPHWAADRALWFKLDLGVVINTE